MVFVSFKQSDFEAASLHQTVLGHQTTFAHARQNKQAYKTSKTVYSRDILELSLF